MRVTALILLGLWVGGRAQEVPKAVPVPRPVPGFRGQREAPEPTTPAAQTVVDGRARVEFRLPAGWNLNRRDGEVSTFHLDARTAPRRAKMRVVASLAFNPFPLSTFAGALFYLSVTPHSSAEACVAQAEGKPNKGLSGAVVGDVKFRRGKDEHGHICTEARDVVYTAMRGGSCVRFDLVVNTFCGGDVSGAEEITEAQLGAIFKRMDGVLETVKFVAR